MVERSPFAADTPAMLASADSKTAAIAQVASAYAAKESSTVADILELVDGLSRAFHTVERAAAQASETAPQGTPTPTGATSVPAVPIEEAVQEDKVICLECGESFTMLKRHLKAEHGMTEDEYRAKYDLPEDFPLVAPAYSRRKAEYARQSGLGKHSRDTASPDEI